MVKSASMRPESSTLESQEPTVSIVSSNCFTKVFFATQSLIFSIGRVVPVEFIGYCQSCQPFALEYVEDSIPNHDELMANFFAQPDALAMGKTGDELRAEGVPENLVPHKTFTGDRPSSS